ncbi:filamentous hemagglutinin family N-terminal domain-containing protein, partial [Formivibrio citricus]
MKSVDSLRLAINEPTETRAPSLLQKIVLWITLVSCTVQPVLAASPIVADPNAGSKKPGVEAALNGVPVVQIVAPNSNGVSHNQYQQFNVESRGAILNNSQGIVQTQQGGYIAGNPNLTGGTARIILNEVTSSNPSLLQGHVEVAGTRAEVVLANPNGITCNGCGFINTSRGVLTTGTPVFGGDGSLNAYRVTGGQIRIDNAGLYGSSTDQLDLIARSVAVNGQLWANQLNVIAGANQVNHANLSTQQIAGMGNAPSVSIDVGALGGMYANKIRLVGTEAGVGVVNAGTLSAQNGDFSIDSQGRITLTGNTSATGVLQLTARDGVSHGGTTYGQQGVQVTTPGDVQNTGTLAAGSDLSIQAASVQSSGVLGGGVQPDSTVGNSGNLTVTTSGQLTANGQNVAGGHISLTAAGINLANSQTSANGNVQLAAQSGDLDLSGSRTSAGGDLALNATGAVNHDNGQTQAGRITVDAASLSSRSGTLSQSGTADTRITVTGALDNTAGTLASNGNNLTVQAGSLTNSQGRISHAGTGQLTVTTGALQNDQGLIAGNGQVAVTATSLDNRSGQVLAAGNANLQVSGPVDNRQGQLKSYDGDLTLSTQGALNNVAGRIEANGTTSAMTVSASDIDNTGGRIANIGTRKTTINSSQGIANSNAGNVNGMGMIGGNGELEVNAGSLANTQNGQIVSGDRMTLNLSGAAQNSGSITATGPLSLTSASLDNSAGEIGTQQGSGSDLRLQTSTLTNSAGKIGSDRNITLSADTVTGAGQIIAAQDVSLNVAGDFTNGTGNQIKANRDMTLTAGGTLINRGQLEAVNNLNLNATHIDNQSGAGINANQTTLAATGNLTNAGRIEGNTVNAGAASLTNTGTVIGGDVTVTANSLTNDGATALIASTGNTKLWVRDTLTNQNGATVYSMGDLSIAASSQRDGNGRLQDRTTTILNDSSTLETDGNLEVAVTNLTNRRAVQIGTTDLGTVAANKSNVILWEWGCTRDENGLQDCTNTWVNRQLNIRGQYTAPKVVTIDAGNLNTNDTTNKVLTLKTPLFFGDYQFHLFSDDNSTPQTKPWEWYAGTIYYESLTPINNGTQYQLSFYPGMGPNMMRPSEIRSAGLTDRGELWEAWRRQQVRTQEEQVTQQGADSRILAGNNIKVSLGGTLTNEQGQIAAGANIDINGSTTALGDVTGGSVVNVSRGLVRTTTTSGTSGYWTWAGNVPRYAERTDPLSTQTAVTGTVAGSITAGQSININTASVNNQTVFSANVPAGGNGGTLDAGQNHGAPNGGVTSAASQSAPAFNLPQNALYTRHTEPGARYLIETDPRFANFGNFISSDYMLSRLNLNPEQTQKRLGDGFYEQRLVLDQIAQLTGRRTLGQYASAEDQFKALMDQGVTMAQQYNLTPGISLSAAQVAALTSDLVWLESRSVTLPDGSNQQVLTPVVYLARVHADDLKPNGALIAAADLTLQTSGTLTNSGTLRGNSLTLQGNDVINRGGNIDGSTQTLIVANQDIVNESGTVNGGRVALLAGRDLLNTTQAIQLADASGSNTLLGSRGNLASRSDLVIQTGRDLTINGANLNATGDATLMAGRNLDIGALETRASATGGREGLSSSVTRTVNATSSLNANNLTLQSGGDTTIKGAALNATDSLTLQAQGDIKLQAVKDDQTQSYQTAGSNYRYGGTRRDETVVGSQLSAGNAIHLSAGPSGEGAGPTPSGNLLLESATVTSSNGQIALNAGNNITVAETAERHESTYNLQESKKGFLNSKTTTLQDQSNGTTAVGSTLSGNSIALTTGNNLTVRGSNVVGTQDVQLNAGNNVTIQAATHTYSESHVKDVKESGLLGNGGSIGFTIGSRQQTDKNNQDGTTQSQSRSLIGSTDGSLTISAGKDATIRGSDLVAGQDLNVSAQRILIDPGQDVRRTVETHEFKQSGLTVAVSSPVLSAAQTAYTMGKMVGEAKDG